MSKSRPSKLYRDPERARIMGVCAGLADYFGINTCFVRFLTIVAAIFLFFWPVVIGYFILGFALERRPDDLYEDKQDEEFWRTVRTRPDYTMVDLRQRFRDVEKRTRDLEAYITSRQFRLNREFERLQD